jgi:hypothetical protein
MNPDRSTSCSVANFPKSWQRYHQPQRKQRGLGGDDDPVHTTGPHRLALRIQRRVVFRAPTLTHHGRPWVSFSDTKSAGIIRYSRCMGTPIPSEQEGRPHTPVMRPPVATADGGLLQSVFQRSSQSHQPGDQRLEQPDQQRQTQRSEKRCQCARLPGPGWQPGQNGAQMCTVIPYSNAPARKSNTTSRFAASVNCDPP